MSKRTIGLIVALFVITVILLLVALSGNKSVAPSNPTSMLPSPTPFAQSLLTFSPATLTASTAGQQTASISLNTNANDVTGVQLELSYDPKAISNVTIDNGTMFPNPLVLRKKIDPQAGTITYVYAITPAQQSHKGIGTVAVITFTPNVQAVGTTGTKLTQTMIKLLPKSEISARGIEKSVMDPASLNNSLLINL